MFSYTCNNYNESVWEEYKSYENIGGDEDKGKGKDKDKDKDKALSIDLPSIDDSSVRIAAPPIEAGSGSASLWENMSTEISIELEAAAEGGSERKFMDRYLKGLESEAESGRRKGRGGGGGKEELEERAVEEPIVVNFNLENRLKAVVKVKNLKLVAVLEGGGARLNARLLRAKAKVKVKE